jgi:hypothetical protein
MTANDTNTRRPSAEEILDAAPPVRNEPGAREYIRAAHAAAGRRIAVLDDDPTARRQCTMSPSSPFSRTTSMPPVWPHRGPPASS